jgi:uncharacterized protein (DUF58 family)
MAGAPAKTDLPLGAVSEALAQTLPALILDARRAAATLVLGGHGKRQAGSGEAFWQHREWSQGESLRHIDWRRSARSDTLYVREREWQAQAHLQIWCDHRPGMMWRGDANRPTKAQRGLVIGLALALAARAGGERVTICGSQAPFVDELGFAQHMVVVGQSSADLDQGSRLRGGHIVLVSDGLESPEIWTARARLLAANRATITLVLIEDPAERDFPYEGRSLFQAGADGDAILIGRPQAARAAYRAAYARHRAAVGECMRASGGTVFEHATDADPKPLLTALAQHLSRAGVAPAVRGKTAGEVGN